MSNTIAPTTTTMIDDDEPKTSAPEWERLIIILVIFFGVIPISILLVRFAKWLKRYLQNHFNIVYNPELASKEPLNFSDLVSLIEIESSDDEEPYNISSKPTAITTKDVRALFSEEDLGSFWFNFRRILAPESLRVWLIASSLGKWWNLFQGGLTVIAVLIYLVEVYEDKTSNFVFSIEIVITTFFAIDYFLYFYASEDRWKFFWYWASLVDLITILPVVSGLFVDPSNIRSTGSTALRPLRILKILRIFKTSKVLRSSIPEDTTDLNKQAFALALTVLSLLFVAAGLFQVLEPQQEMPWHISLYFAIVTFTTVGYGDIHPETTEGRMVFAVLIIVGFVLVTYQTGKFISLINSFQPEQGSFYGKKKSSHVVVIGPVSAEFLREFFQKGIHKTLKVVALLQKVEPKFEEILNEHPSYKKHVKFFTGNPLLVRDLERVDIRRAAACFVMSTKTSGGLLEDAGTIHECLAVRRFSPETPVHAQFFSSRSRIEVTSLRLKNSFFIREAALRILAHSVITPGFTTLITNLSRTYSVGAIPELLHDWQKEYFSGIGFELYQAPIPSFMCGHPFHKGAFKGYKYCGNSILIGLALNENDKLSVIFNPEVLAEHVLSERDVGLWIARTERELHIFPSGYEPHRKKRDPKEEINLKSLDVVKGNTSLHYLEKKEQLLKSSGSEHPLGISLGPEDSEEQRRLTTFDKLHDYGISYQDFVSGQSGKSFGPWMDRFNLLTRRRSLQEALLSKHRDLAAHLTGHVVIVCHQLMNLEDFLFPLRARNLSHQPEVVIFCTGEVTEEQWKFHCSFFPDVYLIYDLSPFQYIGKANITTASKVVLLPFPKPASNDQGRFYEDSESLILYRHVKKLMRSSDRIISQFYHDDTLKFTSWQETTIDTSPRWYTPPTVANKMPDYHFISTFCSGEIFTTSLLDSLLSQSFFNPFLVLVLRLILLPDKVDLARKQMFIKAEPVTEFGSPRTWISLFKVMALECHLIPIGLFRSHKVHQAPTNYVFTNPPPTTEIHHEDLVYYMSQDG